MKIDQTSKRPVNWTRVTLFSVTLACLSLVMFSCVSDPNSPGLEYMPDMYRSPSLETYGENAFFADSMNARTPATGSIPRGFMPFGYPKSDEGFEDATANLKNPLRQMADFADKKKDLLAEGKEVYTKFCTHCHGAKGKGDGKVTTSPNWPGPPPAYDAIDGLTEGRMYYSIHYGKGNMGSHASQISAEDRWKVILYVSQLAGTDKDEAKTEEKAEGDAADAEAQADNADGDNETEAEGEGDAETPEGEDGE